jgi:hypothetical protein
MGAAMYYPRHMSKSEGRPPTWGEILRGHRIEERPVTWAEVIKLRPEVEELRKEAIELGRADDACGHEGDVSWRRVLQRSLKKLVVPSAEGLYQESPLLSLSAHGVVEHRFYEEYAGKGAAEQKLRKIIKTAATNLRQERDELRRQLVALLPPQVDFE